jgi:hypothetical protein
MHVPNQLLVKEKPVLLDTASARIGSSHHSIETADLPKYPFRIEMID